MVGAVAAPSPLRGAKEAQLPDPRAAQRRNGDLAPHRRRRGPLLPRRVDAPRAAHRARRARSAADAEATEASAPAAIAETSCTLWISREAAIAEGREIPY